MPLRADREVEPFALGGLHVTGQRRRVEVEVGVDVADPAAAGLAGAGLDRVALAEIPVVVEDADVWSSLSITRSAVPSTEPSETTIISNGSSIAAAIRSRIVRTFSAIMSAWS